MVAPVPAQISKLRPRLPGLPAAVRRRRLLATHYSLPTLFFPAFKHSTPLVPIRSLQPQQFHAITHSFAQRRAAIPPVLNGFRTLSIATGACLESLADNRLSDFQRVNSFVYESLAPVCPLFAPFSAIRFLCFQSLAASFPKTPGGWGTRLRCNMESERGCTFERGIKR